MKVIRKKMKIRKKFIRVRDRLWRYLVDKFTPGGEVERSRLDRFSRGSTDWLRLAERYFGGKVENIERRKVSELDPRLEKKISTGGMIGGDRMSHHNYARHYAKHLERFVVRPDGLVILECGILRGTGLAVWSLLFPEAMIVGMDIDPGHTQENLSFLKSRGAFENSDPILLNFDQFRPDTTELAKCLDRRKLEIVIDDGNHSIEAICNTFEALRPFLADNCVYFVEDNKKVHEILKNIAKDFDVYPYGELTVLEKRQT